MGCGESDDETNFFKPMNNTDNMPADECNSARTSAPASTESVESGESIQDPTPSTYEGISNPVASQCVQVVDQWVVEVIAVIPIPVIPVVLFSFYWPEYNISEHANTKQNTTVEIKNIPPELDRHEFTDILRQRGFEYSSVNMPLDHNQLNLGYVSVDLVSQEVANRFMQQREEVVEAVWARHHQRADINKQSCLDSMRTTVMVQNVPRKQSPEDFLKIIDKEGFKGQYDFVYLPWDPESGEVNPKNRGYVFVNLRSHDMALKFMEGKTCGWAEKKQGFEDNMRYYRNRKNSAMHESIPESYRPTFWDVTDEHSRRIVFEPKKNRRPPRFVYANKK